uniref:Uncharacterized protein n=1 Tax=Anguilla anguilla TaxID=7936 RepID=A0A0E9T3R8_ANGAN
MKLLAQNGSRASPRCALVLLVVKLSFPSSLWSTLRSV